MFSQVLALTEHQQLLANLLQALRVVTKSKPATPDVLIFADFAKRA
jgi:hypothetical protein